MRLSQLIIRKSLPKSLFENMPNTFNCVEVEEVGRETKLLNTI